MAWLFSPFMLPMHISYGGLSFLISTLNNIFVLFYMTTFVRVFKIDSTSFYVGETIFMVWNSVNDPLFGWMSDIRNYGNHDQNGTNMEDIVLKRLHILSRYGPLFALSFLLFCFHLFPVGIQFSLALCLYDSFLSIVDIHHQALLADLVIDSKERIKLNSYCSIFSAVSTISVFISYQLWDVNDLSSFQLFCCVMALFTFVGFRVCCHSMEYICSTRRTKDVKHNITSGPTTHDGSNTISFTKYAKQVCRHRNFIVFSLMNFIQVFHCHFNSNFFPLVLSRYIDSSMATKYGGLVMGMSFLIPHLNNLYFLHLCKKWGSYRIMQALFAIKFLVGVAMWKIGFTLWYFLCIFLVFNRVFTEGICKLLNLVLSDIVDEDYVKFRRKSPVAALIVGTAALLSKPGQTLAPMFGSYLFNVYTGNSLFADDEGKEPNSAIIHVDPNVTKERFFRVFVSVPIVCAVLQIFIWNFFSLRGKYLEEIKRNRSNAPSMSRDTLLV